MIIDSHVHAFPNLGGSSGFSDAKQHSKYTQHNMASHHQPIRDMSDNSIVRIQTLCQELLHNFLDQPNLLLYQLYLHKNW